MKVRGLVTLAAVVLLAGCSTSNPTAPELEAPSHPARSGSQTATQSVLGDDPAEGEPDTTERGTLMIGGG